MKYKIVPSSTESKERFFYLMEKLLQTFEGPKLKSKFYFHKMLVEVFFGVFIFLKYSQKSAFLYFVNNAFNQPRHTVTLQY